MISLRKLLALLIALVFIAGVWLWWNRPQKVDMANYVPADALVYLEANDLPLIVEGLVQTDAWKRLAPPAGINSGLGQIGWLSRLSAWTGIGSAETVVLARAQVAIVMLGLEAADAGETLKIRPRYAVIAETHTSEWRTRAAVEKRVGEFARRAYGEPSIERKKVDDIELVIWRAPSGERQIIAAVTGSVVVIGTDEASVRSCLAVRRGERPSLAGSPLLEEMRSRVESRTALAFGYVSPQGAAQLLEVAGAAYIGQISDNPQIQGAIASWLPQLSSKLLGGGGGWSARFVEGLVEDRYFIALPNEVSARLRLPLAPSDAKTLEASKLLPPDTYRITRYNLRDTAAAWRGLNAALSSQLDALGAVGVSLLLKAALRQYGIEDPDSFLTAIGSEAVTASPDASGTGSLVIVEARDEKALRDFVNKHLGQQPRTEKIGDAELLVSREEEKGAASFVAGHLLMGSEALVRRCLESRAQGETLDAAARFQQSMRKAASGRAPSTVLTLTDDESSAQKFIVSIAAQRGARTRPTNTAELERSLASIPYTVSETNLIEGGFEKRTRSAFGQFGTLASQFSPDASQ